MIEPNILPEFEQPEAPKQQEKEQPKTGGAPESSEEVEGQQPKSAEAAELKVPANQEHKTRPAADPAAMIRDAEPRLIRKLIEMGLQGDFRAITYLLITVGTLIRSNWATSRLRTMAWKTFGNS